MLSNIISLNIAQICQVLFNPLFGKCSIKHAFEFLNNCVELFCTAINFGITSNDIRSSFRQLSQTNGANYEGFLFISKAMFYSCKSPIYAKIVQWENQTFIVFLPHSFYVSQHHRVEHYISNKNKILAITAFEGPTMSSQCLSVAQIHWYQSW